MTGQTNQYYWEKSNQVSFLFCLCFYFCFWYAHAIFDRIMLLITHNAPDGMPSAHTCTHIKWHHINYYQSSGRMSPNSIEFILNTIRTSNDGSSNNNVSKQEKRNVQIARPIIHLYRHTTHEERRTIWKEGERNVHRLSAIVTLLRISDHVSSSAHFMSY